MGRGCISTVRWVLGFNEGTVSHKQRGEHLICSFKRKTVDEMIKYSEDGFLN